MNMNNEQLCKVYELKEWKWSQVTALKPEELNIDLQGQDYVYVKLWRDRM